MEKIPLPMILFEKKKKNFLNLVLKENQPSLDWVSEEAEAPT